MRLHKAFMLPALVLLALASAGCGLILVAGGAAAGGLGVVAYLEGNLEAMDDVAFDKAWKAARAGLEELKYTITKEDKGPTSASLIAHGAKDERVEVRLSPTSAKTTKITVRVGMMGDKGKSQFILDTIRGHYPKDASSKN